MVEISATSKLPIRLLYTWAKIRYTDHHDKSPLIMAILNDPFWAPPPPILGSVSSDSEEEEDPKDTNNSRNSRSRGNGSRGSRSGRSTSLSGAAAAESPLYIVANFWNLPSLTIHQTRSVDTGLRVDGRNVQQQVHANLPPQTTNYIPIQWRKFLDAVTNGNEFKHDENLYRLLTRIGVPYVDIAISDTQVKYHYLFDVLSLPKDKDSSYSGQSSLNLTVSPSSRDTGTTTPNGTVIQHPPTPNGNMDRLAGISNRGDRDDSLNAGQPSVSMGSGSHTSFNLPSFNGFQQRLQQQKGENDEPYDPLLLQPIQHRGLPDLFRTLVEHDPIKRLLAKSLPTCNYIHEPWFQAVLKMMPFLYWSAQAYASSIQGGIEVAKAIRDGIDPVTKEVRGDIALRLLTDHCCKLTDSAKDPSQQIYLLILVICKVLTQGTAMNIPERTLFMNKLFEYLGDGNKFSIMDITEFLLGGEWIVYLDVELPKATKGISKRFKETSWLPPQSDTQPEYLNIIVKGTMAWKEKFLHTFEGLNDVHEFLTSKADDNCSLM